MYIYLKRAIDIFGAIIVLIICAPIMLVSIIAIYISMGRPILYSHIRSGKGQTPFKILKLRTMKFKERDDESDEERITKLGEFLRKYSIDELPQLINVLRGNMSLVGPRPLLIEYNEKFNKKQKLRFDVKPGITGLAQISGRNTIKWNEKLDYDIEYVENVGLLLDMKIAIKTVWVVISARGFRRAGEASRFDA